MAYGIILDIDGTLVDSNRQHALSWARALQSEGLNFPLEQIQRLIGMGGDKLLPTLTGIHEKTEAGQRLSQLRSKIFKEEFLPHLSAFPDSVALLRLMRSWGFELSVGTSGSRDDLEAILKITGLDSVLKPSKGTSQVSKDDAGASKPEPDIIEVALKEMDVAPENAFMLGDTPYDIHAAKMARVKTVAFRSGGWEDAGLRGAIAIYDGPSDLLAGWEQSPFALHISRNSIERQAS